MQFQFPKQYHGLYNNMTPEQVQCKIFNEKGKKVAVVEKFINEQLKNTKYGNSARVGVILTPRYHSKRLEL